MSDWDKDPHEGTIWAKDPHRGTVWSNNPHQGTIWDNRYDNRQPGIPANETWAQRVERERLERQDVYRGSSNSRGRGGFSVPTIALFLVLFNVGIIYAHTAIAGVINADTAGSENLRHGLLSWLSLAFYIFVPISSTILIINLLLRRYWSGVMLIIATGILSFIGTGIYLVISGVFFGK